MKGEYQQILLDSYGSTLNVPGPYDQIENLIEWNKRYNLCLSGAMIGAIPPPPAWPLERMQAVVLVPYLTSVRATFEGLFRTLVGELNTCSLLNNAKLRINRQTSVRTDPELFRVTDSVSHPICICRWEVINFVKYFDTNKGVSVEMARADQTNLHAGALAALAHFPNYALQMDGVKIPYMLIPGYSLNFEGQTSWAHAISIGILQPETRSSGIKVTDLRKHYKLLCHSTPIHQLVKRDAIPSLV